MPGLMRYLGSIILWWAAIAAGRHPSRSRWLALPLAAAMVWLQWTAAARATPHLYRDFFRAYLYAGCQVTRQAQRLYEFPDTRRPGGFVNLPIVAYAFAPLCRFHPSRALRIFTMLATLAAAASLGWLLWWTGAQGWRRSAIVGLFIANGPLYYDVALANTSRFVLLALVAAFWLLRRERPGLAGAVLGAIGVLKLPLLAVGGYFAVRRQWAAFGGFVAAVGLCLGASLGLFGMDLHRVWYGTAIAPYSWQPLAAFNDQSIGSFLLRARGEGDLVSWYPVAVPLGDHVARTLAVLELLAVAGWCWWGLGSDDSGSDRGGLGLSSALCLSLIVSPVSWTHYFVVLLVPLSLWAAGELGIPEGAGWSRAMTIGAFLISSPVFRGGVGVAGIDALVHRVIVSSCLLGTLVLLATMLAAGRSIRSENSAMERDEESSHRSWTPPPPTAENPIPR